MATSGFLITLILWVITMDKDKKPTYRVNFTMPTGGRGGITTDLACKVAEVFEHKRELGILRHWLMELAYKDIQKEQSIGLAPEFVPMTIPKKPSVKPVTRKIEKPLEPTRTDLAESSPVFTKLSPEQEAEADRILREDYDDDWDTFIEHHKPIRLSGL